ncbi:MAG TPA: hypothetical protein PK587_00720 [Syntrophales bacterium]|nr:hypothetical protein [Syntrophales bacterium]
MKRFEEALGKKKRAAAAVLLAAGLVVLNACAPSLYSIDMRYTPQGAKPSGERKTAVTVATFIDGRNLKDPLRIGTVYKTDGQGVPVYPRLMSPTDAVTAAAGKVLGRSGYNVSARKPVWDLNEHSLSSDWGKIVIGGRIEEMDVVCRDTLPIKKYRAKVRLTLFLADAEKGRILYRAAAESSTSLDHVLFSEDRLESQINTALSDAVEKLFEGKAIDNKIREALK